MSQISKLWHCDIWKCRKLSHFFKSWYKATFTFCLWIGLGTALRKPGTQNPVHCQVFNLCFAASKNQQNDVTMWRNLHICTKFQKVVTFWEVLKKTFRNLAASHRTWNVTYKRKKLEPAPILESCFRVGGSFSQNPETTFLFGPVGRHVEHHAASALRCRGAGDQHCVEMTIWGGRPTCILLLHLIDCQWLLFDMVTLGRSAQFLPLKWKKDEKSTEKWCRSRTEPKGNMKECSWRVDPLSEAVVCELGYLLVWSCLPSEFTPRLLFRFFGRGISILAVKWFI